MNRRRKAAFILSVCLTVALTAACSSGAGTQTPGGSGGGTVSEGGSAAPGGAAASPQSGGGEAAQEPATYKWMIAERPDAAVRDDWPVMKKLTEYTNVTVQFDPVPNAAFEEKLNITLATNSVSDITSLNANAMKKYGPEGVFLRLNELIESHAPNLKKIMDENPEIAVTMTAEDGGIYGFPSLGEFKAGYYQYGFVSRYDLIEKHNLTLPENTEQFYELLAELKRLYPDSYPFTMRGLTGNSETSVIRVFTQFFTGIGGLFGYNPATDQYEFAPLHPNFYEMLQYLNKLYSEELLDPEVPVMNVDMWTQRMLTGKSFVTWDNASRGDRFTAEAAAANPELGIRMGPLPDLGHKDMKPVRFDVGKVSGHVVSLSSKIKNPERAVQFMDFFYSEEGRKLMALGIEGESYAMVDGKPQYIIENPTPDMFTALRRDFGAIYDGLHRDRSLRVVAEIKSDYYYKHAAMVEGNLVPAPKPFIESSELAELKKNEQTNVEAYYEQEVSKLIIGQTPLNEESFKRFVDQMVSLGAVKVVEKMNEDYKNTYSQ